MFKALWLEVLGFQKLGVFDKLIGLLKFRRKSNLISKKKYIFLF